MDKWLSCCWKETPTTETPNLEPSSFQQSSSEPPDISTVDPTICDSTLTSSAAPTTSEELQQAITLSPTLEECISLFETLNKVGYLMDTIDNLLQSLQNMSKEDKTLKRSIVSGSFAYSLKGEETSVWACLVKSGAEFIEFLNKHIQAVEGDRGTTTSQAVAEILQDVGNVHCLVAALSMVAFLIDQIGHDPDDQRKIYIELLVEMVKLILNIRPLNYDKPQQLRLLSETILWIVEGSMMCACLINSNRIFSFFKASVDFSNLQSKIKELYKHFESRVGKEIQHHQPVPSRPSPADDTDATQANQRSSADRERTEYEIDEDSLFSMQNSLRVLALGNRIKVTGEGQKKFQFKELRFLRISGEVSCLKRLPEWLQHSTRLKVLILDECDKMEELPDQIFELASLNNLSICGGTSLRTLPDYFDKLLSLQELKLTGCKELKKLPLSFVQLKSLKNLNLGGCIGLTELPSTFGKLTGLKVLNLEGCGELRELPSSFGQLKSLINLSLTGCMKLESLPLSEKQARSLQEFSLSGSNDLLRLLRLIKIA